MLNTLNSLSAPYLLYSGSLLMMYRNCSVGNADIDFSLQLDWWRENKEVLDNALVDAGFSHGVTFGNITHTWGYEEAWRMHGWKADIFILWSEIITKLRSGSKERNILAHSH